ncbi:histidine kinase [Methylovirgula ligni]|uniref:histidine kinase n=1 Tax=Methylovirgula ligni TaxID=569860 RepID=A0A3D9YND5_9HYPH|nr:sensor histidine kinase [Methylovirgula ligni]QAY96609.1 histidine kinase [Methylovirgula ligni]REF84077.1 signal transduction histidine kinase [Methylovirgula ligni]
MRDSQPFIENSDARTLAQAIVDTVREPLLVLDKDLRVLAASRSFYRTFKVASGNTQGQLVYELGDGQWDIPELRLLLERIVPEHGVMDDYEVERHFPELGQRTMLLNARKVFYEGNSHTTLLLGIEDVTARRALEREREELLRKQQALLQEKDMLLEELEHRVGNSLQIIAAIILMKSRMVTSEETRLQLQDAHKRVLSVAAVQKHLHATGATGPVEMAPYLTQLCDSLKTSMIGDYRPATLKVISDAGTVTSREAVSLGLIVTELILNALKHAFTDDRTNRQITVGFAIAGTNWKLSVADNGVGAPVGVFAQPKSGLGTTIVNALAQQLEARVDVVSGREGTSVLVTHATFAKMPDEASQERGLSSPTSIPGHA